MSAREAEGREERAVPVVDLPPPSETPHARVVYHHTDGSGRPGRVELRRALRRPEVLLWVPRAVYVYGRPGMPGGWPDDADVTEAVADILGRAGRPEARRRGARWSGVALAGGKPHGVNLEADLVVLETEVWVDDGGRVW